MLKNRLIAVLFLRDGHLVRSEEFSQYRILGNPVAQVERYNAWDVDELIYLDISRQGGRDIQRSDLGSDVGARVRTIDDLITSVSRRCFMPLTFGGGIRSLEMARRRFALGADKISVNSQALRDPNFISQLAREFGSQAVVVSIDARREEGDYLVFGEGGTLPTGLPAARWAHEAQERGAGEILINSIDRDGTAQGYDLGLVSSVVQATSIPVIACGGVGSYRHFEEGVTQAGAAAVAAGNIFHFRELAYPMAKRHLKSVNLNFR